MDINTLVDWLNDEQRAADLFRRWGIENAHRAHANMLEIAQSGITVDLLAIICEQLEQSLPWCSDADMALNNLQRFIAAARSPLSLGSLFERDPRALPTLVQVFSTSQYMADWLVRDPATFDLLRMTEGHPIARQVLVEEIKDEMKAARDEAMAMSILRRYKHRETLRIAYGDIVVGQDVSVVTRQISYLADAICDAAFEFAWRVLRERFGDPQTPDGERAGLVVLGLGKLGGEELNYSSDIDLILISECDGKTSGPKSVDNREFFERLARLLVKLLGEATELGAAYRVDLRLRPGGSHAPAVIPVDSALQYYDMSGRTWERQAFVKARPVAGDRELGRRFLEQLESWIYRRYLSGADIAGIKALKRKIEQRARRAGQEFHDVKTGHGGIRDIEFSIQFLQLLNGGDLPEVRTPNTLQAIVALEQVGCLTMQERTLLADHYAFLRKLEHRLQLMFDLQTHQLPESDYERRKLAIRAGYQVQDGETALERFERDLREKTEINRRILDHLLHDAFSDDPQAEPETDLILDPDPDPEWVADVLSRHGFQDPAAAYRRLQDLAREKISFLSTRRCRHFLAAIAPRLLAAIASTPDPDQTLVDLVRVSDSVGGKGVLWELFQTHPPSLQLYTRLCGCSPYLSGILTSNPGMIDFLLDSLLLDRLPTWSELEQNLTELSHGAEELDPILHAFKSDQHLRIGVRDILGKEDLADIHRALSDVAEVCVRCIAAHEYRGLVDRFGYPAQEEIPHTADQCDFVILGMGKFGGREPNYHSDLDVMFVYDEEGMTQPHQRRASATSHQHFFSQWGQRVVKFVTRMGRYGRLYEMDPRLRPTGKSGALAISRDGFLRYFTGGSGQLWERQALCKARPVFGSPTARRRLMEAVHEAILATPFRPEDAREIHSMRMRLEETASAQNLKRGRGGTVDIEFAVQMLQLKWAHRQIDVLVPGTLAAMDALHQAGALSQGDARFLAQAYRFLRGIETGLRLMNTVARHDLPTDERELRKLAYLLRYPSHEELVQQCEDIRSATRNRFLRLVEETAAD